MVEDMSCIMTVVVNKLTDVHNLTPDIEESKQYGEIVLQVEYDLHNSKHNNYNPNLCFAEIYENKK